MNKLRPSLVGALGAALLLGAVSVSPVAAAGSVTVHVGCPGGKANMSKLVQAVRDANMRAPRTTVLYLSGGCTYTFWRAHSFPADEGANALPVIHAHLVIHGQGASLARRDGAARFRLAMVAADGNLSIDHLTLSGGRARNGRAGTNNGNGTGTDATPGRPGGALYNLGTLKLDTVTLTDNQAGKGGVGGPATTPNAADGPNGGDPGSDADAASGGAGGSGGNGGAIYSRGGTLIISNSTLANNTAGDGGAGGSAAAGNGGRGAPGNPGGDGGRGGDANGGNAGDGGSGGAIYVDTGTLTISSSTIDANAAGNGGDAGTATAGDGGDGNNNQGEGGNGGSAVSQVGGDGGDGSAMFLFATSATVTDVTVSNNHAGDGGNATASGGDGGNGGCNGVGGDGGAGSATGGAGGANPIFANGGHVSSSGETEVGNVDGSGGAGSGSGGDAGDTGHPCE